MFSEYENQRKFSIVNDSKAHVTINTEPKYLKVDDPNNLGISNQNGKNYVELERIEQDPQYANNQNIPNYALNEKTENVYLKPFN